MSVKNRHLTPTKAAQVLLEGFTEAARLAAARGELLGIASVGLSEDKPSLKSKRAVQFAHSGQYGTPPKKLRVKAVVPRPKAQAV